MRLYSSLKESFTSVPKVITEIKRTVTIAAGNAIQRFVRNLSFISQPCPLHAAIVVSEIKERLSPNIAPPITEPTHNAGSNLEALATAMAIGVISVMVPTDVPIATETKQLTTNKTITANCGGMIESKK